MKKLFLVLFVAIVTTQALVNAIPETTPANNALELRMAKAGV